MEPVCQALYDVLKMVRIFGPTDDGLIHLCFETDEGADEITVKADSHAAESLKIWRKEIAKAMARAELQDLIKNS
jgi:hypothetical protein